MSAAVLVRLHHRHNKIAEVRSIQESTRRYKYSHTGRKIQWTKHNIFAG